jgi:hypothetical protein
MKIETRIIGWVGHVTRMVEERKLLNVLVGKPEEKTEMYMGGWDPNAC